MSVGGALLRLALFWSVATSAMEPADHTGTSTQRGVLRIGTTGDYAPYSWRDEASGTYRGADIALARALALQLGLRAEFISTTWPALLPDAQAGRFDVAIGGISITPDRALVAGFSKPYARDSKQPVVRCGEERRYDSLREINRPDVRLIVNPGGTNERFARKQLPAAALAVHADNRSIFDEILAKRADVMVTDSVEGRLQQRAGNGLCTVNVGTHWAPAQKAVLLAAGPHLKHSMDSALARSGAARRYQGELQAWESHDWSSASTPSMQIATLIDERLAIVTEVARAKWNSRTEIEDPPREQALLASLRERAGPLGVSDDSVDHFFGAQIEAAKLLQTELFSRWRKEQRGPFIGVADLARDIRPQLDRVTAQMLAVLAAAVKGQRAPLPQASTMNLISPAAVLAARAPLIDAQGT